MTWVKICGTTNLEDALIAVEAGADAVGFVFYEKSPRNLSARAAQEIIHELPISIEKVGVFVNAAEEVIDSVIEETAITAVQMHGDNEDPDVADRIVERRSGIKIIPAISMKRPNPESRATMWDSKLVYAFLLDSGANGKNGGTGERFDWNGSSDSVDAIRAIGRFVAAGGLCPSNVSGAMDVLKPWGVDVVSGVEASPGKKDREKVRSFLRAVRAYDRRVNKATAYSSPASPVRNDIE